MLTTTYYCATLKICRTECDCFCIIWNNGCETDQQRPLEKRVDMTSIKKKKFYIKFSQTISILQPSELLQSFGFRSVIYFRVIKKLSSNNEEHVVQAWPKAALAFINRTHMTPDNNPVRINKHEFRLRLAHVWHLTSQPLQQARLSVQSRHRDSELFNNLEQKNNSTYSLRSWLTTQAQWEETHFCCVWRFPWLFFHGTLEEWYLLDRIFFLQRLFLLVISPFAVECFTDEKRTSEWMLKVTKIHYILYFHYLLAQKCWFYTLKPSLMYKSKGRVLGYVTYTRLKTFWGHCTL